MSKNKSNNNNNAPKGSFNPYWIYAILGLLIVGALFVGNASSDKKEITSKFFFNEMVAGHDVKKVVIVNKSIAQVYLKDDAKKNEKYKELLEGSKGFDAYDAFFQIGSLDAFIEEMNEVEDDFTPDEEIAISYVDKKSWTDALYVFGPLLLIILFFVFMMRRMSGGLGGGSQIFNIGKSKATLFDQGKKVPINFNDVAGLDEAKEEVMEIVNFLKEPQKYTRLGGKIPKGALLIGPPGTGKTLLAKAMAGEAKVPFFSISGSDFVEMFVGVGASRVRDLFKQAREKAPCIIFVDEIDAIGRARGRNVMQGNDERENTLNQLLVEMDGFGSDKGVILVAATNRPDVLDSALLRPGRFDRQIAIDRPDMKGREAIFKVHVKNIKLDKSLDVSKLAAQTPGFVGADIANICNEAALVAARKNKTEVQLDDFNDAIDRVIGGLEKKNKIISPEEKEIIAYHEAGHAICGWFLEHAHPLVKVSIVPRGVAALGYAQYLPKEKYIQRSEEILDRMCMTMGGRAAEKIIFNKISTGAQSDLDTATKSAYSMVVVYGMNEKVGNVSYYDMLEKNTFQRPYSDDTARIIDEEVKAIIGGQYVRAQNLLKSKEKELHALAKALLDKEVIFKDDLEGIIGPRPFKDEDNHIPVDANANVSEPSDEHDNTGTNDDELI